MIFPLRRGDAMAHKGLHIVLDIREDTIDTSQCPFCGSLSKRRHLIVLV